METSKPEDWDGEPPGLEYQKLPSPSHIRLFRIPKDGREGSYELIAVDMADDPTYNALSYTWGNPLSSNNPENQIYINRQSQVLFSNGQSLSIGRNLNTALLHFQDLEIHGDIWIDAICINQNDIKERNAQVAIMGDIYANAEKVIVWLGDEDADSQTASFFLDVLLPKLEHLDESEGSPDGMLSFLNPRLYARLDFPMSSQESFDGLANFFERAWFQRTWTFQEIVLARQADVICGTRYIDWDRFKKLLGLLQLSDWHLRLSRFQDVSEHQQIPAGMVHRAMDYREHILRGRPHGSARHRYFERITAGNKPLDLLMGELDLLLCSMRHRRATDLRDHVYAIYGIADRYCQERDISNPLAAPNYNGSAKQAYTECCRAILENSNTLLLLSNVEDRPDESSQFPSWVPDFSKVWTVGLPSTGTGAYYNVTKNSRPRLLPSSNKNDLTIEGYLFDTVIGLGESDLELVNMIIPLTKCAEILLELPPKYATGQDRAEVFWRTLIADQTLDQFPAPPAMSEAFYEYMLERSSMAILNAGLSTIKDVERAGFGHLAQLAASTPEASRTLPSLPKILERKDTYAEIAAIRELQRSEQGLTPKQIERRNTVLQLIMTEHEKALPFIRRLTNTKRLVTTSKGFMGSAPESTREGDQIYLLSGGRVPFVLRPRSDGTYRLMGESYVHGIMQGEAFEREQLVASEVTLV